MKEIVIFFLCVCGALSAEQRVVERQVGGQVTLDIVPPGSTKLKRDDQILWSFGPSSDSTLLVNFMNNHSTYGPGQHFRGRLQLNHQTGALTIRQLSFNDSGPYKGQLVSGEGAVQPHVLLVYAPVSPPLFKCRHSDHQNLFLESSAKNGRNVTLSCHKGEERLNQTSSSDLSANLYLPLVVERDNISSYSCMSENPVSNRTSRINLEQLCLNDTESGRHHIALVVVFALVVAVMVLLLILLLLVSREDGVTCC